MSKKFNVQKRIWIWLPKYHFYIDISTKFKKGKKSESGHKNFTKFQEKKSEMIQIKSEWIAGLQLYRVKEQWFDSMLLPLRQQAFILGVYLLPYNES